MKSYPILQNVYARVDVLDFDIKTTTFSKVGSVFLLGDAKQYVNDIQDLTIRNKSLVSAIGVNTVKALIEGYKHIDVKTGGDDWDELDEMDIEELLNSESSNIVSKKEIPNQTVIKGSQITDLILHTKDKLFDVYEKVSIATDIRPHKQYLWSNEINKSMNGDEVSIMNYWQNAVRLVEGYPIDGYYISESNQNELTVEDISDNSVAILTCISLDSIISDKSILQFLAKNDAESYELIHTNTIQRFFPLITLPVFNQYILDETRLESKFDSFSFDKKELLNTYKNRAALLNELNKTPKINIDSSNVLTAATTDITLSFQLSSSSLNTIDIFRFINVNEFLEIKTIDLFYFQNYKTYRIRKIQQKNQFITNKDSFTYSNARSHKEIFNKNALIISLLPTDKFLNLNIILDSTGTLWIRSQPNESNPLPKVQFIEQISSDVNKIIKTINSFDSAFITKERLLLLSSNSNDFKVLTSSSKLNFKIALSYNNVLGIVISKLVSSGFLELDTNTVSDNHRRNTIKYLMKYGVSRDSNKKERSSIEIKNVSGIAIIDIVNLDLEETNLYVDILGRMIVAYGSKITIEEKEQMQLAAVDPVLFKPKLQSDGYSRICQRRFQPMIADPSDSKAVEYYNFTFDKPQHYKCPSKDAPVLGFIKGKHPNGYCLPCCRKTHQIDHIKVKESCIAKENEDESKTSTYKIEYPIPDIPNAKIMNRRIFLPDYISNLFEKKSLVANGTILASHGEIRDGIKPHIHSYLQSATIIAAVNYEDKPLYKSHREFVLDVIEMIKQPQYQMIIMKHRLIAGRYTTPQDLIFAIEEHYIKNTVLEPFSNLSAVEWNDFMIFMANQIGINVVLLSDDRNAINAIELLNLQDVDTTKHTLIILKRLNVEWSSRHHNTRALYLPVTSTGFKVSKLSPLTIERIDISKALTKLKTLTSGSITKTLDKLFTIDRLTDFTKSKSGYKVVSQIDQKIAVIQLRKETLISTISTLSTTIKHENLNIKPTMTFDNAVSFIRDYNLESLNRTEDMKSIMTDYRRYLQIAIKSGPYDFVSLSAFLLKINKLIQYNGLIIGMIVNIVNVKQIIATELMFFKPTTQKAIMKSINIAQSELKSIETRINEKAILCFPFERNFIQMDKTEQMIVNWITNPIDISISAGTCDKSLVSYFNKGMYSSHIYKLMTRNVVDTWLTESSHELIDFIVSNIKKLGSIPLTQTKIELLCSNILKQFNTYDATIINSTIQSLFDTINSKSKTMSEATQQVKSFPAFTGFSVKHIHKLNRKVLRKKVESAVKEISIKKSNYPVFDSTIPITDQYDKFYVVKEKNETKLIIHPDLYDDLINMFVADLLNPFRREFIIGAKQLDTAIDKIKPNENELIFIQSF